MTKQIEVSRIPVPPTGPFNYAAAKALVDAATSRRDEVVVDGQDIVILSKVAA